MSANTPRTWDGLVGRVVAVDTRQLSSQSNALTCEIGTVESYDLKSDKAIVSFKDGRRDTFRLDRLITLKPHNDIVMKLIRNWNIPTEDFQQIITLYNLYRHGDTIGALKMAVKSDTIRERCTVSCRDWLRQQLSARKPTKQKAGKRIK